VVHRSHDVRRSTRSFCETEKSRRTVRCLWFCIYAKPLRTLAKMHAVAMLPYPGRAGAPHLRPSERRFPLLIGWQDVELASPGSVRPWYDLGCYFGCGPHTKQSGGLSKSAVQSALSSSFSQARSSGVRTVHRWVSSGRRWQIRRIAAAHREVLIPTSTQASIRHGLANAYDLY